MVLPLAPRHLLPIARPLWPFPASVTRPAAAATPAASAAPAAAVPAAAAAAAAAADASPAATPTAAASAARVVAVAAATAAAASASTLPFQLLVLRRVAAADVILAVVRLGGTGHLQPHRWPPPLETVSVFCSFAAIAIKEGASQPQIPAVFVLISSADAELAVLSLPRVTLSFEL